MILSDSVVLIASFFSVDIAKDEQFLTSEKNPKLTVMSAGHALHVFINGQLTGNHEIFQLFSKKKCVSLTVKSKLVF
jgi:hypothetical protein